MKKYILVAHNMMIEIFTYRFNFILWRIRVVLTLLTTYFLWASILPSGKEIFGYTSSQMLTYILITYFINSFVLSSRSFGIGEEIIQGHLSNFLIRPVNYFGYWFAKDVGDKLMNILFMIAEFSIIIFFFNPPVFMQTNALFIFFSIIAVVIGIIIYFLFNILLSSIGFWSQEVWAPRFIFAIVINFFAGVLFPLDILPKPVFIFFQTLPFTYLIYFPAKLYLGNLEIYQILLGLFVSLSWCAILLVLVRVVWRKGLMSYGAYGR